MTCGMATIVTTEPWVGRAFPRYHGGRYVSANHGRAKSSTYTTSDASAVSPVFLMIRTEARMVDPTSPAVRVATFFPIPERVGCGDPFIVKLNTAVSLSNVGVAACIDTVSPGEGEVGVAMSETGSGKKRPRAK